MSAHYVVFEDGRIVQCVPEARRAWHAGAACWAGEADINSRSIGIEIANPGHDYGYPDFPDRQIDAVIALSRDIVARHGIAAERVLAHSDVAPARKQDPGEKFPWARLHAGGVGRWVAPVPVDEAGPVLVHDDEGKAIRDLQTKLASYGYCISATGLFDATTGEVVAAFQRHFRPACISGRADASTVQTLAKLLAASADT